MNQLLESDLSQISVDNLTLIEQPIKMPSTGTWISASKLGPEFWDWDINNKAFYHAKFKINKEKLLPKHLVKQEVIFWLNKINENYLSWDEMAEKQNDNDSDNSSSAIDASMEGFDNEIGDMQLYVLTSGFVHTVLDDITDKNNNNNNMKYEENDEAKYNLIFENEKTLKCIHYAHTHRQEFDEIFTHPWTSQLGNTSSLQYDESNTWKSLDDWKCHLKSNNHSIEDKFVVDTIVNGLPKIYNKTTLLFSGGVDIRREHAMNAFIRPNFIPFHNNNNKFDKNNPTASVVYKKYDTHFTSMYCWLPCSMCNCYDLGEREAQKLGQFIYLHVQNISKLAALEIAYYVHGQFFTNFELLCKLFETAYYD